MPANKNGCGRKRKFVPNISQRSGPSSRPSNPLPPQYTFTPADQVLPNLSSTPPNPVHDQPSTSARTVNVRDFPPPTQLFQSTSEHQPEPATQTQTQGNSNVQSNQSVNDFEDADPIDDNAQMQADLQEDQLRVLEALLRVPNRHEYTTVLSPFRPQPPNTTWFGRDKGKLTRKITKVFINKFDGPYYSWSVVPRDRQERYFVEFAKTHTWDPLISGVVQQHFEKICQRRMKDMICTARRTRVRPHWINPTLWTTMTECWDTLEAQKRSKTTSAARKSDRKGLGEHKHVSGQKSYQQIHQEMVEELGRPVSIGDVFVKTHTRSDGTFVDLKAERIAQNYEKNLQAKMQELATETSDGTSQHRELTTEEYNKLFFQSTFTDERGRAYGLGSLAESHVSGKSNFEECSSSFQALQDKLEQAQRQIEEQAASNARREAELTKLAADQQSKFEHYSLVESYLRQTDPKFLDFMASQSQSQSLSQHESTP